MDETRDFSDAPITEAGFEVSPEAVGGLAAAFRQESITANNLTKRPIPTTFDVDPEDLGELPPVYQFPIVQTVSTRFYDVGPFQPLPFPDSDD